jgi:ribosomal protein L12E/L44/L45/RPP1/RPP2
VLTAPGARPGGCGGHARPGRGRKKGGGKKQKKRKKRREEKKKEKKEENKIKREIGREEK